ncbi:unnamed protein product, partial [Iphiclides podalirius]
MPGQCGPVDLECSSNRALARDETSRRAGDPCRQELPERTDVHLCAHPGARAAQNVFRAILTNVQRIRLRA